jgi:hypothetical protein
MIGRSHKIFKNLALFRPFKFFHRVNDKLGFVFGVLNGVPIRFFHKHGSSNSIIQPNSLCHLMTFMEKDKAQFRGE